MRKLARNALLVTTGFGIYLLCLGNPAGTGLLIIVLFFGLFYVMEPRE